MIRPVVVRRRSVSIAESRARSAQGQREALALYLGELDAEFGPVPDELVAEYDELWP